MVVVHWTLFLALIQSGGGWRSEKHAVVSLILIRDIGYLVAWIIAKVDALLKLVVL